MLRIALLAALVAASLAVVVQPVARQAPDVNVDLRNSPGPTQSAFPSQVPVDPRPTRTPGASAQPLPSPVPARPPVPASSGVPSVSPTASASPNAGAAGGAAPQSTRARGLTTGGIVGIVIGSLVLLAFVLMLVFFVFRRGNNREDEENARSPPPVSTGAPDGGEYGTPESAVPPVQEVPPAREVPPVQEVVVERAEAEPGYVVSDVARHHAGVAAAPVAAAAAGAGAAGAVAAAPPSAEEEAPAPAPHDYVVGVGQIKSQDEFEDIKTRFARDEIVDQVDQTAVLGAAPAIEGEAPTPADATEAAATDGTTDKAADGATEAALEQPAAEATETAPNAALMTTPPASEAPAPGEGDTKVEAEAPAVEPTPEVENVSKAAEIAADAPSFDERSGDVSEAVRGLGVTEIIAEEAAVTPALESDALPDAPKVGGDK